MNLCSEVRHRYHTKYAMIKTIISVIITAIFFVGCLNSPQKPISVKTTEDDPNKIIYGSWKTLERKFNEHPERNVQAIINLKNYIQIDNIRDALGDDFTSTAIYFRPKNYNIIQGVTLDTPAIIPQDLHKVREEISTWAELYKISTIEKESYSDAVYQSYIEGNVEIYAIAVVASPQQLIKTWKNNDQVRFISTSDTELFPGLAVRPGKSLRLVR